MNRARRIAALPALLKQRVLVLDGAMGTMIQAHKLDEAGYRGKRFADWRQDLKGNNDLLTLTQPEIIFDIHTAYLEAAPTSSKPIRSTQRRSRKPITAWRASFTN